MFSWRQGWQLHLTSTRTNARIAAMTIPNKLSVVSGETSDCEIVDIALSGVAFKAAVRPLVGRTFALWQKRRGGRAAYRGWFRGGIFRAAGT